MKVMCEYVNIIIINVKKHVKNLLMYLCSYFYLQINSNELRLNKILQQK